MRRRGGYATLSTIFADAPKIEGVKFGGKTPNATMRKIVQLDARFFRIRPGLWALKEFRDRIPFIEEAMAPHNSPKEEEFTHGYYQGLLVEIGNMRKHTTYVPPQDKNRQFLGKPLSSFATLERLYSFGYDQLVNRAKTVDVIWFNERDMPCSFQEVEHSTDIINSLVKFNDLQDFHAEFKIVAPANRRKDYESKISKGSFRDIQGRVEFVTYEDLVQMHTALGSMHSLTSKL